MQGQPTRAKPIIVRPNKTEVNHSKANPCKANQSKANESKKCLKTIESKPVSQSKVYRTMSVRARFIGQCQSEQGLSDNVSQSKANKSNAKQNKITSLILILIRAEKSTL
jgi:hypothetical protein